jgi:hypothetical protein
MIDTDKQFQESAQQTCIDVLGLDYNYRCCAMLSLHLCAWHTFMMSLLQRVTGVRMDRVAFELLQCLKHIFIPALDACSAVCCIEFASCNNNANAMTARRQWTLVKLISIKPNAVTPREKCSDKCLGLEACRYCHLSLSAKYPVDSRSMRCSFLKSHLRTQVQGSFIDPVDCRS